MSRAQLTSTVEQSSGGAVAPVVAGKNAVINGALDYWQRGTSFTFSGSGAGGYTADRWNSTNSGTNISWTATQDTSVPSPAYSYSLKTTQTSSNATGVSEYGLRYKIEQQAAQTLTGQYATVSFWYKSNQTGSHYVRTATISGTGSTDSAITFNVPTANTWQYVTFTTATFLNITAWTGSPSSWGAYIDLGFTGAVGGQGSTIAANAYFQITGVQLEAGRVATPFSRAGGTLQGELAAAQRYYWRQTATTDAYTKFATGLANGTSTYQIATNNPVTMRTSPSSVDGSALAILDGASIISVSSVTLNAASNLIGGIQANGTGFTASRAGMLIANNNTAAYLGFNAEL
jgi:hypothetical protein